MPKAKRKISKNKTQIFRKKKMQGKTNMVFGLGTKKTTKKTVSGSKTAKSTSSQAAEAAAVLKKMEDKKKSGECAFC